MMLSEKSLVVLGLIASAAAFPRSIPYVNTTSSPCAEVSASAAAVLAVSPSATPIVDAGLAYDCLTSVSLHQAEALELVDSILPYVQWQTNTAYLADPPSGYQEPAVDIFAAFDAIKAKINGTINGTYANEHEFQEDLYLTFASAHDGHFRFSPDGLTKALSFGRTVKIVSVSSDGVELPKVYSYDDVVTSLSTNSSFAPSALTTINGEDVYTFLEDLSQKGALQDPDALYNTLFFELALNSTGSNWGGYFSGSGRFGYIYPGPNTTISFENGTTTTYQNYARVIGDFTGVTDGETFYEVFCNPLATTTESNTTTTENTTTVVSVPGYPSPVVLHPEGAIGGYFLDGAAYDDVAVLSIPVYEADDIAAFQSVAQTLISDAKAAGKTKLIVDLSANPGGYIFLGYDIFRQLFPQIAQDGYSRFREHEAFNLVSEFISAAIPANYSPSTASDLEIDLYESPFNYRYDLDINNNSFPTYDAKFAPAEYQGDNFTQIMRWDLRDPLLTTNATWGLGIAVTGYENRTNFTQPFAAKDIIMVYDGYCASTCTLFSEFMRTQGGVKSISFGGRHSSSGIQAIGGTKGANNYGFGDIYSYTDLVYELTTPEQQSNLTILAEHTLLPVNRSTDTSINMRDNILPANVEDGVPAQFIYEEADCRLYYTPEMTVDASAIWKKAADVAWGNATCVAGSLPARKRSLKQRSSKTKMEPVRKHVKRGQLISESGLSPAKLAMLGRKVPI